MTSSIRDRHGRGARGPAAMGPVGGPRPPALRSRREVFDSHVLAAAQRLEARWRDQLGLVEYAVEDTPFITADWGDAPVPLASLVRGHGTRPTRIVVFRRPLEHRAPDRVDLEVLIHHVVVEQVAELLGLPAEDVDPGYEVD